MTVCDTQSMRRHLQRVTHDTHQALHDDPILRQLSSPDLTETAYETALAVFATFYEAIEHTRTLCAVSETFSVQRECDALSCDLGRRVTAPQALGVHDPSECLGALYVAHGASFGRNTFRKTVTQCFSHRPHHFVTLGLDSRTWNALLVTLDAHGASPEGRLAIQTGATRAFSFMQDITRTNLSLCVPV